MPPNVSLVIPEVLVVTPKKGGAKLDGEFEAALESLAASSFAGVADLPMPALQTEESTPPEAKLNDKRNSAELATDSVIEALAAMMIPVTMTPPAMTAPQSPATTVEPPAEGATMEVITANTPVAARPQLKTGPIETKEFVAPVPVKEPEPALKAKPERAQSVEQPIPAKVEAAPRQIPQPPAEAGASTAPSAGNVEEAEITVRTKDGNAKIEHETASHADKPAKATTVQGANVNTEHMTLGHADKPAKAANVQSANLNTEHVAASQTDKPEKAANVQGASVNTEHQTVSHTDKPEKAANVQGANVNAEHATASRTDKPQKAATVQHANVNTEHKMVSRADKPENAEGVQRASTNTDQATASQADRTQVEARLQRANVKVDGDPMGGVKVESKPAHIVSAQTENTNVEQKIMNGSEKPASAGKTQGANANAQREPANGDSLESKPARASSESKAVHAGGQMQTPAAPMREQAAALNRQLRDGSGSPTNTTARPETVNHAEKPEIAVKVEAGKTAPVRAEETVPVGATGLPAKPAGDSSPAISPAEPGPVIAKLPEPLRPVVMTLRNLAAEGREEVRLQLQPESLGRVEVRLHYDGAEVRVHLSAETAQTSALLQSHAPDLRSALIEAGVTVGQLSVTVGDGRSPGSQSSFDSQDRQAFTPGEAGERAPRESAATPARPVSARPGLSSRVDYRV